MSSSERDQLFKLFFSASAMSLSPDKDQVVVAGKEVKIVSITQVSFKLVNCPQL